MIEESVSAGRMRCLSPSSVRRPVSQNPSCDRLAAAEGREPAEPHREDGDEEDAGEKDRDRDAEHAQTQESASRRARAGEPRNRCRRDSDRRSTIRLAPSTSSKLAGNLASMTSSVGRL